MSIIANGRAVITGASSGIGATYADRLAKAGRSLLLVARRGDRLAELKSKLEGRYSVQVETFVADLTKPSDLAAVEERVLSEANAILINNAGSGGLGPFAQSKPDQLENVIALNVTALTRLSHAALRAFTARSTGGALVNISSVLAHMPSPSGAVYSGSKAYVLNFTRSLQLEYAKSNIRIQVILPGPVRTEFFSSQGVSESVFPEKSFLTADQLVDAALKGLEDGEQVTIPSLGDLEPWEKLEGARGAFLMPTLSGVVAERYQ